MKLTDEEKLMNPWDFACKWYSEEAAIDAVTKPTLSQSGDRIRQPLLVPKDVYSVEFAKWLTKQYRHAMAKGVEIGKEMANGQRNQKR